MNYIHQKINEFICGTSLYQGNKFKVLKLIQRNKTR